MTFPRYPEYRESAVEWIGEIPVHWKIDRLKVSIKSCRNGIWGNEANGDAYDIPCVRVADFDRIKLEVKQEIPTIRNVTEKEQASRILKKGDLLIEKSGGGENQPVGCVVLYDKEQKAVCSNFVAKIELATNMDPAYWRYVHSAAYSVRLTIGSINQTSGIQNLDQDRYFNERSAYPPINEQIAIAKFLENETKKIDKLIDEQQKLIELLKEKRQAVISHAVTKGLDTKVELKDSEVDWLGKVPKHWDVVPLKYFVSMKSGEQITSEQIIEEGAFPVYGGNGLRGYFEKYTHDGEYPLIGRQGALCGNINYANGKFWASEHAVVVTPQKKANVFYLGELLRSMNLGQYSTSAAQPGLSVEAIGNLRIPAPIIEEQNHIADYLLIESSKWESLIEAATQSISLFLERRSALIAAAVTGQIDVRTFQPKEVA